MVDLNTLDALIVVGFMLMCAGIVIGIIKLYEWWLWR